MNYEQAVKYLLTLGRELASPQQARAAKFDLENIRALMERLGHPERAYPTAHIAGTNGKGSTAAMLASILQQADLRVGLYTSPHLLRINERLRIVDQKAGGDISDADFAETFTRLHSVIEELLADGRLAAHPTYFECVTAMAFDFFARQKVGFAVIEVGMGGRLDSTNIIEPEVAVITQIDFDHENFLGHSIENIAGEKAGIIKPGAWVVSSAGRSAATEVIRRRAAEQNARIVEPEDVYVVSDLRAQDGCYRFVVAERQSSSAARRDIAVELPLAGRYQVRNALTALAAAHLLAERGFPVDDAAIARGLAAVRWPGRIERLQAGHMACPQEQGPAVYIDGTHNTAGARELVAFWMEHFAGRRIHLVYGTMRDKAVDEVAGLLFPHATTVILTQSRQPRSLSAEALATVAGHLAESYEVIADPGAALERAIQLANPDDIVFAAGSLYLVGDLRRYWDARASARQPSGVPHRSTPA